MCMENALPNINGHAVILLNTNELFYPVSAKTNSFYWTRSLLNIDAGESRCILCGPPCMYIVRIELRVRPPRARSFVNVTGVTLRFRRGIRNFEQYSSSTFKPPLTESLHSCQPLKL